MGVFTRLFGIWQKKPALKGLGPVDWILRTPYSSAAYGRFQDSAGKEITCFIIHEDADHLRRLPENLSIDVRCALFERSAVGLVVVMLRVEGEIYETSWNFHSPELRPCFQNLSTQEALLFRFFVDAVEPARTIWIPNPLRSIFSPLIEALAVMPHWTMEGFSNAKEELSREYPTVQALWDGMVE